MEEFHQKELTINGTYTLNNDGTYLVDLRALENENLLLSLKVTVPSKKQASSLLINGMKIQQIFIIVL